MAHFQQQGACKLKVNEDQLNLFATGLTPDLQFLCVFQDHLGGFTKGLKVRVLNVIPPGFMNTKVESRSPDKSFDRIVEVFLGNSKQYFSKATGALLEHLLKSSYKLHLSFKDALGEDVYIAAVYVPGVDLAGYRQCTKEIDYSSN